MPNADVSRSLFAASIAALLFAGCSANGSQLNPPAAPMGANTLGRTNPATTSSTCAPSSTPGWALNPNSVVDGDFAGTTPSNYTLNQFLAPGPWQVSLGDVDEEDSVEFPFPGGACSVDLDGHSPGAIAQTFNTSPNTQYKVKFYLSGNGDGAPNVKRLKVTADNGQATFYHWHLNSEGKAQNGDYAIKFYHFTSGPNGTTTLQFASGDPSWSPYGPVVFQISARI